MAQDLSSLPAPYSRRIDRVRRYIAENLDGDLSLDRLCDVAAMSRFHWHRTFRTLTGETLAEAVRRARLNRAAVLIVRTDRPIAAIARAVGYDNADSFARSFRAAHGETPAAMRAGGILPPPLPQPNRKDLPMIDVTLRDEPAFTVAALPHHGPYNEIARTYGKLGGALGAARIMPGPGIAFYYDDPSQVAPADL